MPIKMYNYTIIQVYGVIDIYIYIYYGNSAFVSL